MKKNNSLKLFYKLAKRAYKVSKKRKLDWKWSDAQKWTSANLFKKYKGTKNLSKLKVTTIDKEVEGTLDGIITPTTVVATQAPTKQKKICYSPFQVGSFLLEPFEWFEIEEKLSILNDDLQVDLDLEYDGIVFAKTGIIKKELLPNLKQLREEIRKTFKNDSDFPTIGMYITLIEGAEDDRTIPCNYYVLITFDDSIQLNVLERKGLIIREFISKKEMPASELERVTLLQKEKEDEKKRLSKEKIKKFNLPTKVEPKKVEPKAKTAVEDTKANRTAEYNKAIEKLESLLERKLITKKQFSQRFDQLGKNLKDGGEI